VIYKLTIVAVPILASLTYRDAIAHSGATGIVKERMDYFKASQSNLKKTECLLVMKITNQLYRWPIA